MEMVLSVQELHEALAAVQLRCRRIRHELKDYSSRFQQILESDILFGQVKVGINQVIANQHLPILYALYEAYRMLEEELRRMIDASMSHVGERDNAAVIRESAIDQVLGYGHGMGLSDYTTAKEEFDQEFRNIYHGIGDIMSLEMPSNNTYENRVDGLYNTLKEINDRLQDFSFDMTPIRDFIQQIDSEIDNLASTVDKPFPDTGRMAISGRLEFRAAIQALHNVSLQAQGEQIEALLNEWHGQDPAVIFANLRRPLSEAEALAWSAFTGDTVGMSPEERMAIGREQRNNGIFLIAGGGVLIVLTGGKAAPFVVKYLTGASAATIAAATTVVKASGFTLGGSSITLGAAELGEGLHNMHLGSEGDVLSPSSNFLRDTVFGGDQSLYNAFRNDVSAATMIVNYTLISIPGLKPRSTTVPPPPVRNRLLSNGRTLRMSNDFNGFRGDFHNQNIPRMSNVNGRLVVVKPSPITPPVRTTNVNGRAVPVHTGDYIIARGNMQIANVAHIRNVNGQWVRVNNGRAVTGIKWNNYFRARYGAGNVRWVSEHNFGRTTSAIWSNRTAELATHAPISVPQHAVVRIQPKKGYDQISYKWRENGQTFEVRWHTKTPGAPAGQRNTWVITRRTPGLPTGQRAVEHIRVGERWIPRYQWEAASRAYQNGVATQEQLRILENGHWPAP